MKTKLLLTSVLFCVLSTFGYGQERCLYGNCQNGYGKWTDGGSVVYEGYFLNSRFHGQGKLTTGNAEMQGQWEKGEMNGQGMILYSDGIKIEGYFEKSELNGFGSMIIPNVGKYVGQWKEGKKDGQGIFTWTDGGKYEGQWKEGKQDGQGTCTWANGNKYVGQWKEGKKDGQGTWTGANGDKYIGEFKDDKKFGKGLFLFVDGIKLIGTFNDQLCNGKLTYPNGNYFVGDLVSGVEGQGRRYFANGEEYFGEWQDGVIVGVAQKPVRDEASSVVLSDYASFLKKKQKPHSVAIIIGNSHYQKTKSVDYATLDAERMKHFLINALGYQEGNVFYIKDANKSDFDTYFGTQDNPEGKLFNAIKPNQSDVFVYYAGHGAPSVKNKKGYFVPTDCDPQYVEQGGYSLDLLYKNLGKISAKSFTVMIDACFSGADIIENISPVHIQLKDPVYYMNNAIVLCSSTSGQYSSWYSEKSSSMFTYFVLQAIEDKAHSDTNKDNKLSYRELYSYVSSRTDGVPYYARRINGVSQDPTIQGDNLDAIVVAYK